MKKSFGAGTFALPTPVWVVGAYDAAGKANVMTAAWGGICCSEPPCLYVSLRKARYTYELIQARGAFTVSVPSQKHAAEADFFGMASGRKVDKLAVAGLSAVRSELVDAPYVAEFPLVMECKLLKLVDLGVHTQFVGEILDVKADSEVLGESGRPVYDKLLPLLFDGANKSYHVSGAYVGQAFFMGKELLERSKG